MSSRCSFGLGVLFLAVAILVVAATAQAQQAGDGFLFKAPAGEISLRGGFDRAMADSDVFSFATDELTLSRRDFSSLTFAIDVDRVLTGRLSLNLSVASSRSTTPSEFRDFVDSNRKPIEQATHFVRVPLTASLKAYLADHGRAVGHFAWIPSRYAPYVGAGGGAMYYRFEQKGDFIDFSTSRVFYDQFSSGGWTPTLQAFVGADGSLNPRVALTTEGRYQWAQSPLGRDFSRFNPIDLSGFALTAGFSFRY